MAQSDVILEENKVVVKGELIVDKISSTRNKLDIESGVEVKGMLSVEAPRGGGRVALLNQKGLFLSGEGEIIARRLTIQGDLRSVIPELYAGKLYAKEFSSRDFKGSEITLGSASGEVAGVNGKVTLLNSQGRPALILDASSRPKIEVPGYGDLIEKLRSLEARVRALES